MPLCRAGMHGPSLLVAAVEQASQQPLPLYRAGTHSPSLLAAVEQAVEGRQGLTSSRARLLGLNGPVGPETQRLSGDAGLHALEAMGPVELVAQGRQHFTSVAGLQARWLRGAVSLVVQGSCGSRGRALLYSRQLAAGKLPTAVAPVVQGRRDSRGRVRLYSRQLAAGNLLSRQPRCRQTGNGSSLLRVP